MNVEFETVTGYDEYYVTARLVVDGRVWTGTGSSERSAMRWAMRQMRRQLRHENKYHGAAHVVKRGTRHTGPK